MRFYQPSEEHQPLLWVGGYALYAVHVIVAALCVSMIATAIFSFANAERLLTSLLFFSNDVLRGEVWRIFTYGLVNPPSLWFAIDMLMLVWFGREVEKMFGRRKFLLLYGGIYLLPPLLFTLMGFWKFIPLSGAPGSMAIFVAFATLYPNAVLMFNILAKWAALVLIGLYTLMAFSNRDTIHLAELWVTAGFAFAFVRYQQGHFSLPKITLFKRKPRLRVLPDPKPARTARSTPVTTATPARASRADMVEIDALLDKIAKSGLSSLTPGERARLDSARNEISRRRFGK